MVKIDAFKKILRKTQSELKLSLMKFLSKADYCPIVGDGFLYGEGTIPIMLVAHLDTVHKTIPEEIYFDEEKFVVWSPTGIGGDDRCGVYLIMRLLSRGYKPHVLFLEDEEKGCIGARKCVEVLGKPNVKFIVEIDRRGEDDCVFYDCDNKEFQDYIQTFNFKKAWGSCSDICVLSKAWDIASVNLSSGYYNEHTYYEHIKMLHLNKTFMRVIRILEDDNKEKPYYDFQEKIYQTNWLPKKDKVDEESTEAIQFGQYGWWDKYKKYHPYDYDDDEDIYKEYYR